MRYIGVAGQAQFGKDTLADRLHLKLSDKSWKRSALASAVKKVYCETFNVDLEFVEKWKTNPEPPPGFDMNVRQSLQFIGDGFRRIQPNIWLDLAFREKNTIFSDVRYVNEFRRVKKEGGINILVARPDKLNSDTNESESQIRPYIDLLLNYWNATHRDEKYCAKILTHKDFMFLQSIALATKVPLPKDIEMFDIFVCNCGDVDQLYKTVDEYIAPFCDSYVF
jgi:hypothetical protein